MNISASILVAQESHWRRFTCLLAGELLDIVPSIQRIRQQEYLEPTEEAFAGWLEAGLSSLQEGLSLAADPVTFRPLVLEFWPLGVHYVDAVFGATVRPRDGNFWSDLLPTDLADLQPLDLDAVPLVRWTDSAIRRMLEALPAGVLVTTPVLSSPVNIVINLFGERALLDMASAGPDQRRGLQVIADTIAGLHRRFLALSADSRVHFYACSFRYAPAGFGHILRVRDATGRSRDVRGPAGTA